MNSRTTIADSKAFRIFIFVFKLLNVFSSEVYLSLAEAEDFLHILS